MAKPELIRIDARPVVSVIIPTYNNVRYTAQAFMSLARTVTVPYEIIVVDNGSTDETLSFVGSHTPGQLRGKAQGKYPPLWVKLLHNTSPRALAKSWNMGCDAAEGHFMLISNNDVIFTPGAVDRMAAAMRDEWQYGAVLPSNRRTTRGVMPRVRAIPETGSYVRTISENIRAVEKYWEDAHLPDRIRMSPEPYIPQGGYCFMTTKRVFGRVGRFDEDYELTGEDYDWFARNRRHFKMAICESAYVEHFEHTTCGALADEYNDRLCRSRFLLTEKQEGLKEHFSVIMPTWNRADVLKEAIDSVLAQTFQHWRLYVIDDASSDWDRVSAMARRYEQHRNRIWFFRRPERAGAGATRNFGLGQSRGKYVAFLDSDDIWYPNHLEQHWRAHETGNWMMVYSNPDFANRYREEDTKTFYYKLRPHPTIKYTGEFDHDELAKGNFIQTSSMSVWGELARATHFPPHLVVGEDWEYCKSVADVLGKGRPVKKLPVATCRYHISKDPHEEDHLIKHDVPSLGDPDAPDTTKEIVPVPGYAVLGVVIPTKDRHSLIASALRSTGGVPFVVVDDGGMDVSNLAAIVRQQGAGGLLRVPRNAGQSAARNRAVERCRFEWIQFLDDDDILSAEWALQLPPELTDNVDVVTFDAYVPSARGFRPTHEVFTSQICIRREFLLKIGGFREDVSFAEDKELLERIGVHGGRVRHLGVPLVTRPERGGTGLPVPSSATPPRKTVVAGSNWNQRF